MSESMYLGRGRKNYITVRISDNKQMSFKKKKKIVLTDLQDMMYIYIYMLYRKYMLKVLSYKESD